MDSELVSFLFLSNCDEQLIHLARLPAPTRVASCRRRPMWRTLGRCPVCFLKHHSTVSFNALRLPWFVQTLDECEANH